VKSKDPYPEEEVVRTLVALFPACSFFAALFVALCAAKRLP